MQWTAKPVAEERARLQRVITSAIRRAVENSTDGTSDIINADFEVSDDASERFPMGRYHPDRDTYVVPSYQDGGAPTEVPVEEITFEDAPVISDRVVEGEPPFQDALALSFPGNHYVFARSRRYATSGDIAGAYEWRRLLFGATAWAIVAGVNPRGNVIYYAAALSEALTEADLRVQATESLGIPGASGLFGGTVFGNLPGDYHLLSVHFRGGGWSAPSAEAFVSAQQLFREAREQGRGQLQPEMARSLVFGPIDDLLARGGDDDLERAAELLAELNAQAFALLNLETKARYLQVLIRAWTSEPQEVAVVEIIKSASSRQELFDMLGRVRQAGLYDQLFADLDSQIWNLLVTVGERFGDPGPITFEFIVELLMQAGLIRDLTAGITLGPAGPILSASFLTEVEEAARSFVSFLGGMIEGIWMLISHPEKLFEGIGALVKLAVMVQLAQYGYPPAVTYVATLLQNMGQRVLNGLKGAQLLGISEAILRRIRWAILWEVASWFVGIGEVKAILSGVGLTERLAAAARLLGVLGRFGRVADEARLASRFEHLGRLLSRVSVISGEDNFLRLLSHLPEEDLARLGRALEAADIHGAQSMAELTARHPELAEAAQHALGRAEALAQLELWAGGLSDNLVSNFHQMAQRSGFSNRELFDLMGALPSDRASACLEVANVLDPAIVRRLFSETFGGSPDEMARFLARLSSHGPQERGALIEAAVALREVVESTTHKMLRLLTATRVAEVSSRLLGRFPVLGRLNPGAVERIVRAAHAMAEGGGLRRAARWVSAARGQLLEEIAAARARHLLSTRAGREALGLGHITEEMIFIEGSRIRDASGAMLTDGVIVTRRGDQLEIVAVLESKAGEFAAGGLTQSLTGLRRAMSCLSAARAVCDGQEPKRTPSHEERLSSAL